MADRPISLSKARKSKARTDARAKADANAIKFGRTKAQKAHDAADAAHSIARVDGHRLDRLRSDAHHLEADRLEQQSSDGHSLSNRGPHQQNPDGCSPDEPGLDEDRKAPEHNRGADLRRIRGELRSDKGGGDPTHDPGRDPGHDPGHDPGRDPKLDRGHDPHRSLKPVSKLSPRTNRKNDPNNEPGRGSS